MLSLLIGTHCSFNAIGSHKLIGNDTIRWCGFLFGAIALSEEVCYFEVDFEVSYMLNPCPMSQFTSYCLYIKMQNAQHLLQHIVCLHATTLYHDDELNLGKCKQPQQNGFAS